MAGMSGIYMVIYKIIVTIGHRLSCACRENYLRIANADMQACRIKIPVLLRCFYPLVALQR